MNLKIESLGAKNIEICPDLTPDPASDSYYKLKIYISSLHISHIINYSYNSFILRFY